MDKPDIERYVFAEEFLERIEVLQGLVVKMISLKAVHHGLCSHHGRIKIRSARMHQSGRPKPAFELL